MEIGLGINLFPNQGLQACIASLLTARESLLKNGRKVNLYAMQHPGDSGWELLKDLDKFHDIRWCDTLTQRASDLIPGSKSPKPVIYDIFNKMSCNSDEGFMFVNSDIIVSPDALNWIFDNFNNYDSAVFSKVDIDRAPYFSRQVPEGQDGFYLNRDWWRKYNSEFISLPNIIGECAWDNSYTARLCICGRCYIHNKSKALIQHVPHKPRWSRNSIEGNYCAKLWADNYNIRTKWARYMSDTVFSRQYAADILPSTQIDKEVIIQDIIFKG